MIASIQGDVIRTLGPVGNRERELLHTASNLFIEHKMPRYPRGHKFESRTRRGHNEVKTIISFEFNCKAFAVEMREFQAPFS
jgi:hypothetical protein